MNAKNISQEMIAQVPWTQHPLGLPSQWPPRLQITLDIMLHASVPMCLYWGADYYCFCNDAYLPTLGNDRQQPFAMGSKAADVWPTQWPALLAKLQAVRTSGEATCVADRLVPIMVDGALKPAYWTHSFSSVPDAEGGVAGVLATCFETVSEAGRAMDITEQARVQVIRERERLEYEALINNTSDLIWSVDTDLNLITGNKAFLAATKLSFGHELRRGDHLLPYGIVPDEVVATLEGLYREALAGRSVVQELRNPLDNGGKVLWLELTFFPIFDGDEIIGAACFRKDTTARKLAEMRMEASETNYRRLFENSPMPNLVFELGSLKILEVNEAAQVQYRYKREEMTRMYLLDLIPVEAVADLVEMINAMNRGEIKGQFGPMYQQRKDGSIFSAEVNAHPAVYADKHAVIVVANDVTEKLANALRLQDLNKSLTESNRELQNFAAVTAHDLQEPLRMVSSFTGLLAKKYADQLDEKGMQYINFAAEGAKRMHTLIEGILQFSKIGGHVKSDEVIDIDQLLGTVMDDLASRVQASQAIVEIAPIGVTVYGNQNWLYRLFLNLIANALKFVATDKTPRVSVHYLDAGDYHQFDIVDNGIGIAVDNIPRLFQSYTRLHPRQTYEGSGLGLVTCKKIVEFHGGRIWVTSVLGEGSTFHFTILKGGTDENE